MRLTRSLLFGLTLFCFPAVSHAQPWSGVLAPARAIDWSHAGVAGGIPTNYAQCGSTIAAGATAATINAALAACAPNHYVLLGPGVFSLSGEIQWSKNNVVLRGSGANWNTGTRLVFAAGSSVNGPQCGGVRGDICIAGTSLNYAGGGEMNIGNLVAPTGSCATGSFAQGSATLCLGTQTTGGVKPVVGTTLIIDQVQDGTTRAQDTGNLFNCGPHPDCTQGGLGAATRSGTGRGQTQMVVVTSITSGTCTEAAPCTLGISPQIYMPDWRMSQAPQAWWANAPYVSGSGIENLGLDTTADNASNGPNLASIVLYNTQNCWIKNISSERYQPEPAEPAYSNKHIRVYQSHHFTIRDSYFHGRLGTDDYTVNFWHGHDGLVENNIFQNLPNGVLNEAGNGDVIAYNFVIRSNWGTAAGCAPGPAPCWMQGSVYNHGPNESFELSEGNVAIGLEAENYFGQAFFWTAFRNRFTGYNPPLTFQTVPMFIYGLNRYENIVGNVLGTSGYHTNYMMWPTGNTTNTTTTPGAACINSVFAIGLGGNCGNGDGTTWPFNDTIALGTHMIWGNYDVATASNRFVAAENGSAAPVYRALGSPSSSLPASFYLSSQPSWWPSGKPWPPIGPDVTGGNIGICSGGPYNGAQATSAAQCGGGTLASAGINGEANSIPAMDCYLQIGGHPDGTGTLLTAFDANACYSGTPPPIAPASLKATLQ